MRDIRETSAAAAKAVADVKILQKVNAAHAEAFRIMFPGQTEHCLRLVMERLHVGLEKREGVDLTKVDTWRLLPSEIEALARAAQTLHEIHQSLCSNQQS